ncbi:hypothetical protein P7C70_g7335, partial [Phenoliferia sp. Uapishka_3]
MDGRSDCSGYDSKSEERGELEAYRMDSDESKEDQDSVSAWWRRTHSNEDQGEGEALREPWYSWKLWDRRRKWEDRSRMDSESEAQTAQAEQNSYHNSRYHSERDRLRIRYEEAPAGMKGSRVPSGVLSGRVPSGSKGGRVPSGNINEDETSGDENFVQESIKSDNDELTKQEYFEYIRRLNYQDLDEETSWGSKVREPLGVKEVAVLEGALTPGQIIKLAKTGVRVMKKKDFKGVESEEPLKKRVRDWQRSVHDAAKASTKDGKQTLPLDEEESGDVSMSSSDAESTVELEVKHKKTYTYVASTAELLASGLSPIAQGKLAAAVCAGDREKCQDIIYSVNTKYKPVGKKILPVPIALPETLNAPLRRPPMSRDPYETPLTHDQPIFVPGGKLTEERIALMDFGPEGWLTEEERNLILNVLRLREKALAFDGTERGKLKESYADPYKIPVVPHTPWRQSALPIPLAAREKIIETFKSRMEEGLYEKSSSAYSGRWFVVAKKDGKYRIVHDLQPLNAVTIRDAGLPPVMEDFIEDFTGRACLGLMDVFGGFDQRDLADESRDLTTFQTPLGAVRLTRLPTGATNSVAEYQRAMVHILAEEIPEYAGVFVDDVGIKGPKSTYNDEKVAWNPKIRRFIWEYAVTLERILFRFEEAGLTGSGPKAAAVVPELNIVGTVCSKEGRKVSKATRNKIANFPQPRDTTEVRGFLGICTYVRIWIEGFANIARPLRELTKKDAEFVWTKECQESFEKLKNIVGKDILLKKLDYGEGAGKIILSVDSSHIAAGGIIFQEDEKGRKVPARYESLTFTPVESRYSQPKLELAGVAKMLKKLQMYLWGQRFTLEVDASALVQMINAPELPNAPMNRWLRFIQLFDFEIVHVPGKTHTLADGLSRARRDEFDDDARDLDSLISAHVQLDWKLKRDEWGMNFVEKDYESHPGMLMIGRYLARMERPEGLTPTQWQRLQRRALQFKLENGILYKRRGGMLREVVLKQERQLRFLEGVHDDTGHRGREETARRIGDRVWWPGWSQTVKTYVQTCDECQRRKPNTERESRNPSMSTGLFRKFNMDITHIKEGAKPYLLTAREDLTGWVEGRAIPSPSSREVTKFIRETLIPRFGWFHQATVDGGPEFRGEVVKALKELGIKRVVIAPYHPEANGQEERGHQPLVDCLVKITDSPKMWAKNLPLVLFCDRISARRPTGMTPFAMVYGTEAVLPIDHSDTTWLISNWKDEKYSRSDLLFARFVQLERKSEAVEEATERLLKSRMDSLVYHDKVNAHRLRAPLKPGALVLVQNAKLENRKGGKFLPRWTGPYRVNTRLKRGSYLLEELDGTVMKKAYATKRIRRYYARGIDKDDIEEGNEDGEEEEIDNGNEVPKEDEEQSEELYRQRQMDAMSEDEEDIDQPRLFELPQEEMWSEKSEEELPQDSSSSESEASEESVPRARSSRQRRIPDHLVTEGWDLRNGTRGARKRRNATEEVETTPELDSEEELSEANPHNTRLRGRRT